MTSLEWMVMAVLVFGLIYLTAGVAFMFIVRRWAFKDYEERRRNLRKDNEGKA
ncbi:hypothetical protein D3C87_1366710 [compost metagenome]